MKYAMPRMVLEMPALLVIQGQKSLAPVDEGVYPPPTRTTIAAYEADE